MKKKKNQYWYLEGQCKINNEDWVGPFLLFILMGNFIEMFDYAKTITECNCYIYIFQYIRCNRCSNPCAKETAGLLVVWREVPPTSLAGPVTSFCHPVPTTLWLIQVLVPLNSPKNQPTTLVQIFVIKTSISHWDMSKHKCKTNKMVLLLY